MKVTKAREEECKTRLLEILKPGDTVYCILRHVSRSGMYRVISLFGPGVQRIDGYAADLLEGYDKRHNGCRASGCGMDMGFHLVSNLSYVLFPDGFECLGGKCPSSEHSNGDRDYTPHLHRDRGYALRHQWL